MTAIRYLAIAGTHGARRRLDWDHPRSAFADFLRRHGCVPLIEDDRLRFGWSTELDGITGDDETWESAGRNLFHFFCPPLVGGGAPAIPSHETYIIAHSHGAQCVAFACGKYGLKVQGLVTVGMPIRGDLRELYAAAAPNIRVHLHLHAGWRDYWQVTGALFDGRFGIHRKHPHAINERMPKGHGDVLRDPALFDLWRSRGWLRTWQGAREEAACLTS